MYSRRSVVLMLLRPIFFRGGVSIKERHLAVMLRMAQVDGAYPFLTADEQARADKWLNDAGMMLDRLEKESNVR